jgi:ketosteroid isomerase-like protein
VRTGSGRYSGAVSREKVEIVERGFRAFNERDFDALLANFADDVEWRLIGGFAALTGEEFRGRAGVQQFLYELDEYVGGQAEVENLFDLEDGRVLAIVRSKGVGGSSGAPVEMRWGQVYEFRNRLITKVENYYNASEALAAVGRSPPAR